MNQGEYHTGPENRETESAMALPWDLPGDLLNRLWRTTWQVLVSPSRVFASQAPPGYVRPFVYGFTMGVLGGVAHLLVLSAISGQSVLYNKLAYLPLIVTINLLLSSALAHGFLILLKSTGQSFVATFRVFAYANAIYVLAPIPMLGIVLAYLWWLVVVVQGLAAAHGTGKWRVSGAMALAVVCMVLLTKLYSLV